MRINNTRSTSSSIYVSSIHASQHMPKEEKKKASRLASYVRKNIDLFCNTHNMNPEEGRQTRKSATPSGD